MQYAAFFRGINVGSGRAVKMADLRQLFADLGCTQVQSYIQSGNVLFVSDQSPSAMPGHIEDAFQTRYGFASQVILRTAEELHAILRALPFSDEEITQAEAESPGKAHVYVFLSGTPIAPDTIADHTAGPDRAVLSGRELYLLCYQGISRSKLATPLLKPEAKLTSRNLKTLQTLQAMLQKDPEA